MWLWKMRWRIASVEHQTPPASTSSPLFIWRLFFLPSAPITSSRSSLLFSSVYDLCSNKPRCYICYIYIGKSSIASQWGDGVVTRRNTSLSRWCWVFLPELQGLVEWRHRECGTDFLPTAWPEKSISISYKTADISLFILGPLQILDKNKPPLDKC